jgi:TRAP-type C4-dicarboxylate transport system substrate-binding protein
MTFTLTRRGFGIAASAAALGAAAGVPLPASAQARIALKYGNAGNAQTISNKFNALLAERLAAKSNGAITMEIFAGTLGGEQRLVEGMALGLIDVYNGAYTGTREFDILYSPYFFKDGAHAKRVLAGPIGAKAQAVLEAKYQARMIGVGRLGPYIIATNKPISSAADFRGQKIRTPQIEGCIEAVKALGAAPTPVPFNEVYLALQNGTVDGFVSSLPISIAVKFHEVCKYVVANPFGEALDKELIATRTWNRMTPEQRTLLTSTFEELEPEHYWRASTGSIDSDFAAWRERNGADSVVQLPAAEFAAAFEPVNRRLADEVYGAGSWDAIQAA